MMRIVVVVVVVASAARVERARASTIVDASSDVRTGGFAEVRGWALRGTSDAEACRRARVGDGRGRAGRRVDGGGDVCGDQCDVGDAMRGGDGVVEVSARAGWRARPRRGM